MHAGTGAVFSQLRGSAWRIDAESGRRVFLAVYKENCMGSLNRGSDKLTAQAVYLCGDWCFRMISYQKKKHSLTWKLKLSDI